MKYILILVISYVCWQWMSLYLLATSIGKGKEVVKIIKDKNLLNLILKKTGLHLASIRVSSSPKLWGMMIGFPRYPYDFIASAL